MGDPYSVGSLPVPNVQSLAAEFKASAAIPDRYIRPEIQHDPAVVAGRAGDEDLEIPVIDMSKLLDPRFSPEESQKLHLASREWGFFQLVNHNVPDEIIEGMKDDIIKFFELPLEEKKAVSQLPDNLEGYGQLFVVFEDQKLDWADCFLLNTQPLNRRNMCFWPTQPITFRDNLDRYSREVWLLAHTLLGWMVKNLGVDPEIINNMFEDGTQMVRMNYYPPCPQADKALGFSPHSDESFITIVLQVNQVQGLQVKKNGGWISVKPHPGAFIVNIGDRFEIFSNGLYKSIEHRGLVNREQERLSIAAFHGPCLDSSIGPHPQIVGVGKAHYKSMRNGDFLKFFFSSKLNGKRLLDHMKLNE